MDSSSRLDLAPAHVVGNSGGAAIALRLAAKRPDLFHTLVIHEPPLVDLLRDSPEFEGMLQDFDARVSVVVELLGAGDVQGAALPQSIRDTFIQNAPTFLDESRDPEGLTLDLKALAAFDKPALVTIGTDSPPLFKPIAEAVAQVLPRSTLHTFEGASHVPHRSHTGAYAEIVARFCRGPFSPSRAIERETQGSPSC